MKKEEMIEMEKSNQRKISLGCGCVCEGWEWR